MNIWRKHHYFNYDVNIADGFLCINEYTMSRMPYEDILNYILILLNYLRWKLIEKNLKKLFKK